MADIDIVSDILAAAMHAFPNSEFVQSLSHQYLVRGWLTKKQLQGLFDKASKANNIPPGKLATLEAMIAKMPTKTKSQKPAQAAPEEKDEKLENLLDEILARYPQHKRVVYLKSKFFSNEGLTPAEKTEAEKFYKILISK